MMNQARRLSKFAIAVELNLARCWEGPVCARLAFFLDIGISNPSKHCTVSQSAVKQTTSRKRAMSSDCDQAFHVRLDGFRLGQSRDDFAMLKKSCCQIAQQCFAMIAFQTELFTGYTMSHFSILLLISGFPLRLSTKSLLILAYRAINRALADELRFQ